MRRLPIFILVDTSGKMHGERIELVNKKINELISNLKQDLYALETAYIFIASYDMDMRVIIPLTELATDFELPVIEANPSTPSMLGNALSSLNTIFEIKIKKPTAEVKGDYPAVLYILTGGKPSDSAAVHNTMKHIFNKIKIKLRVGLTSYSLVPFYENIFDFNIQIRNINIIDLNAERNGCWISIWSSWNTLVCPSSVPSSTLLPPPLKEIYIY